MTRERQNVWALIDEAIIQLEQAQVLTAGLRKSAEEMVVEEGPWQPFDLATKRAKIATADRITETTATIRQMLAELADTLITGTDLLSHDDTESTTPEGPPR
ncbi:MAG: hypothetical protein FWD18_09160 [Micrococcales bacterium]|nr:hypothetical protein [Micrococcales bacterium]